jgi:hypothetical protein
VPFCGADDSFNIYRAPWGVPVKEMPGRQPEEKSQPEVRAEPAFLMNVAFDVDAGSAMPKEKTRLLA